MSVFSKLAMGGAAALAFNKGRQLSIAKSLITGLKGTLQSVMGTADIQDELKILNENVIKLDKSVEFSVEQGNFSPQFTELIDAVRSLGQITREAVPTDTAESADSLRMLVMATTLEESASDMGVALGKMERMSAAQGEDTIEAMDGIRELSAESIQVSLGLLKEAGKRVKQEAQEFGRLDKTLLKNNDQLGEYQSLLTKLSAEMLAFADPSVQLSGERTAAMFKMLDKQSQMQKDIASGKNLDEDAQQALSDRNLLTVDYKKYLQDELGQRNIQYDKMEGVFTKYSDVISTSYKEGFQDLLGRSAFGGVYDVLKDVTGNFDGIKNIFSKQREDAKARDEEVVELAGESAASAEETREVIQSDSNAAEKRHTENMSATEDMVAAASVQAAEQVKAGEDLKGFFEGTFLESFEDSLRKFGNKDVDLSSLKGFMGGLTAASLMKFGGVIGASIFTGIQLKRLFDAVGSYRSALQLLQESTQRYHDTLDMNEQLLNTKFKEKAARGELETAEQYASLMVMKQGLESLQAERAKKVAEAQTKIGYQAAPLHAEIKELDKEIATKSAMLWNTKKQMRRNIEVKGKAGTATEADIEAYDVWLGQLEEAYQQQQKIAGAAQTIEQFHQREISQGITTGVYDEKAAAREQQKLTDMKKELTEATEIRKELFIPETEIAGETQTAQETVPPGTKAADAAANAEKQIRIKDEEQKKRDLAEAEKLRAQAQAHQMGKDRQTAQKQRSQPPNMNITLPSPRPAPNTIGLLNEGDN